MQRFVSASTLAATFSTVRMLAERPGALVVPTPRA